MKRAQKNFESDPRQKNFLRAKPYGLVKAKNHEQSSWFNKVDNNSARSASHSGLSVCFWTPNIVLVVLGVIDCVFEIKLDLIWFEYWSSYTQFSYVKPRAQLT